MGGGGGCHAAVLSSGAKRLEDWADRTESAVASELVSEAEDAEEKKEEMRRLARFLEGARAWGAAMMEC